MGVAKSIITKLTNRLKKEGFNYERTHGYKHSFAYVWKEEDNVVYISVDDNSFNYFSQWDNESGHKVLIRTAKDIKDFTGGTNNFTYVDPDRNNFKKAIALVKKLTRKDI